MEKEDQRELPGLERQGEAHLIDEIFEVKIWRNRKTSVFHAAARSNLDGQGLVMFNSNFGKLTSELRKRLLEKFVEHFYSAKGTNGEVKKDDNEEEENKEG